MIIVDFFERINPALWVLSNLNLIYIGIALIVFVVLYQIWFDPKATTGGTMIFRFAWSLSLVVAVAFIGIFLDPRHEIPWHKYPGDVLWWRPFVRMAAYSYVAYTLSVLIWFLWNRKFHPEKLRTTPDKLLVKPRHDTAVIPTIKESKND